MNERKEQYDLPEFLTSELKFKETRIEKAINWVEKHREDIHPSISFIQSVELYDFGLDVTQIVPKNK